MYAEAEQSAARQDVLAEAARVAQGHGTGQPPAPGTEVVDAVLSLRPTDPFDAHLRLKGLLALLAHPDAESLVGANKRIANILRKAEDTVPDTYDPGLFTQQAEHDLAGAFAAAEPRARSAADQGHYAEALLALAELRGAVDSFFDHVMVMAEDAAVRRNRLALLATLHRAFTAVADLARLPG
jgi:glycyl-tRNA synthetase beta chain